MPDLPITLRSRTQVCRNSVFSVFLDHVTDASGREVRDYLSVVPHRRAHDKVTGVAVLPVVDGKFGLIRVFRHPLGEYCWEVARGFVDSAESPIAAALRELREETGLVAAAQSLRDLGLVAPEPGVVDARIRLFAATGCTREPGAQEGEMGHREIRFFGRVELAGMLGGSEILDPCTLVCCYRCLGLPA